MAAQKSKKEQNLRKLILPKRTLRSCAFYCSEIAADCHLFMIESTSCKFGQMSTAFSEIPENLLQTEPKVFMNDLHIKFNYSQGNVT